MLLDDESGFFFWFLRMGREGGLLNEVRWLEDEFL